MDFARACSRRKARRQQWRKVSYIAESHQNEKVAAREMVAGVPLHTLILADLGYFAFALLLLTLRYAILPQIES